MSENWIKIEDEFEILEEDEFADMPILEMAEDEFADMPILQRMQSPPAQINNVVGYLTIVFILYSSKLTIQNQIGAGAAVVNDGIEAGEHRSPSPKRGRFVTVHEQNEAEDRGSYTLLNSTTSTNDKFKSRRFLFLFC